MESFDHFSEVSEDDFDINSVFKLIFLGDSGVGKTNIMKRFSEDQFFFNSKPTIGVDFRTKIVKIKNHVIKLQIWDTAGQERYKSFTKAYFKDTKGIIIVYDVTSRSSFENLVNWFTLAEENVKVDDMPIILIGNKLDLIENRVISELEGREFAEKYGAEFIETSAYNNVDDCVGKAFYLILLTIMKHPEFFHPEDHIAKPVVNKREEMQEVELPESLKKNKGPSRISSQQMGQQPQQSGGGGGCAC